MIKMRDLLQEGREIQETFKKNVLTEAISPEYMKQVKKEYVALASKVGKIGKFQFAAENEWHAKTKSGGDAVVYFTPFTHPETGNPQSKLEVSVWLIHTNSQSFQQEFGGSVHSDSKFMKSLNPSKDPKKDAAMAIDYIKKFLTGSDITKILRT